MPRLHCECGKFMKQEIKVGEFNATCVCGAKFNMKHPIIKPKEKG